MVGWLGQDGLCLVCIRESAKISAWGNGEWCEWDKRVTSMPLRVVNTPFGYIRVGAVEPLGGVGQVQNQNEIC